MQIREEVQLCRGSELGSSRAGNRLWTLKPMLPCAFSSNTQLRYIHPWVWGCIQQFSMLVIISEFCWCALLCGRLNTEGWGCPHAMDSGPTSSLTETDQRCHPSSPEITTHKLHPLQNTISPWIGGKIGNVLTLIHFLIISPNPDKTTQKSLRVPLPLIAFLIVLNFFLCRGCKMFNPACES